jgi:hypothetical protein
MRYRLTDHAGHSAPGAPRNQTASTYASPAHRLRRIGVTTAGGASTLGFAVLFASNCAALRNMTLHPLQAQKGASYRAPFLRNTLTRW